MKCLLWDAQTDTKHQFIETCKKEIYFTRVFREQRVENVLVIVHKIKMVQDDTGSDIFKSFNSMKKDFRGNNV